MVGLRFCDQNVDIDAETGQPVVNEPWAPPRHWAAWPLRATLVPPDDFMKRTEDEDEAFTFRRVEADVPSSKLEEAISATILKCAKEKFRARGLNSETNEGGTANSSAHDDMRSSGDELPSSQADVTDEDEEPDAASASAPEPPEQGEPPQRTFRPTVATDDDLSYHLIRPSTRAILEKLDQTLTILHNARMTSAQHLGEATSAISSDDESLYDEAAPARTTRSRASSRARSRTRSASRASTDTERRRSRSISRGPTTGSAHVDASATLGTAKKSNRGRKPRTQPREGETHREFLIRRAREQKKKRPVFSDDEDNGGATTATEAEPTRDDVQSTPARRQREERSESRTACSDDGFWAQRRLARLNLRDWSDVMGAAALAGFSPRVVERATQRCADLFRQGMEMHTVREVPLTAAGSGIETRRYVPGGEVSPYESDVEDEARHVVLSRSQSASRMSSAVPSRQASRAASPFLHEDEDDFPGAGAASPRKRQKRSVSRGGAVGAHCCPHVDCERAYRGFDRAFNLKRHLNLVHGGKGPTATETKTKEKEAEPEDLLGGIHRDGFLEPIRMRRGWRSGDTTKRSKKRISAKRRPDVEEDKEEVEEEVSEDEGSTSEASGNELPSGSEEG